MEKKYIFKNNKICLEPKSLYKLLKPKKFNNRKNDIIIHKNNKNNYFNIRIKKMRKKEIFLLSIVFIIYIIIPNVVKTNINKQRNLEENNYEIILKVGVQGEQQILSSTFNNKPDFIYVNGIRTNLLGSNKILIENNNYPIILKWNSTLDGSDSMFVGLTNIIEIDLSNFNPSYITTMKYMFTNCTNLKK